MTERHPLTVGPEAGEIVRRVGPTAWAVLELLVARAEGELARVSARSAATAIGLSKDTAARALRTLASIGLIERVARRADDGTFAAGVYRVHVPAAVLTRHPERLTSIRLLAEKRPSGSDQLSFLDAG
jgi:DNA-binding IclR family transcriptional regulator